MGISLSALRRIERTRRIQRVTLMLIGAGLVASAIQSAQVRRQKETTQPVVQQALAVCSALGINCEPDGKAYFCRENIPLPKARQMERPLWTVPLQANGRHYAVMLRGDTKQMCYFYELPVDAQNSAAGKPTTPITPERAVNHSLLVMQKLQLAAPDAQIKLEARPKMVPSQDGWRMEWNVRSSPEQTPESIRLVLSRNDGRPLQIVNSAALNANPL